MQQKQNFLLCYELDVLHVFGRTIFIEKSFKDGTIPVLEDNLVVKLLSKDGNRTLYETINRGWSSESHITYNYHEDGTVEMIETDIEGKMITHKDGDRILYETIERGNWLQNRHRTYKYHEDGNVEMIETDIKGNMITHKILKDGTYKIYNDNGQVIEECLEDGTIQIFENGILYKETDPSGRVTIHNKVKRWIKNHLMPF